MKSTQTAERVSATDASDNYVFQRSMLAYYRAAKIVSGNVLEIGTGSGYGVSIIAPHTESFITVDKTAPDAGIVSGKHVEFRRMAVPPLEGIRSDSLDYVISFQVIEHIKDDFGMVNEIHRVLKPGGKLIISTPNRFMSLTRNPWHIREYTVDEFRNLLGSYFSRTESLGVYGNDKVRQYYEKNRKSVQRILKYDVLNLSRRLPRWILRLPYDIMNRRNRRKLLRYNGDLTSSIVMDDYHLGIADDYCYDLFFIAEK